MSEKVSDQWKQWFIPANTKYCTILWEYENQYDKNDRVRNKQTFKPLSYFIEYYQLDRQILFEHWDCVDRSVNCGK